MVKKGIPVACSGFCSLPGVERRSYRQRFRKALGADLWRSWFFRPDDEKEYWRSVLGHHGDISSRPPPSWTADRRESWDDRGGLDPTAALKQLVAVLTDMFSRDVLVGASEPLSASNEALRGFAALVEWADGNASDWEKLPRDSCPPSGLARVAWVRKKVPRGQTVAIDVSATRVDTFSGGGEVRRGGFRRPLAGR